MKTIDSFIYEKLKLNKQSTIDKQFKDLNVGDVIYKMTKHDKYYSSITDCKISNIVFDDKDNNVRVIYTYEDKKGHTVQTSAVFMKDQWDTWDCGLLIDIVYYDIYFINKEYAKEKHKSHITKSIEELQEKISILKDKNNPKYKEHVQDREWKIQELENELKDLLEKQKNQFGI